jgi:hypothetical protein
MVLTFQRYFNISTLTCLPFFGGGGGFQQEREKRERKVMHLSGTLSAMQTSILKQSSRAEQQQQHLQHSQRQNHASSIIPDGVASVPKLRL